MQFRLRARLTVFHQRSPVYPVRPSLGPIGDRLCRFLESPRILSRGFAVSLRLATCGTYGPENRSVLNIYYMEGVLSMGKFRTVNLPMDKDTWKMFSGFCRAHGTTIVQVLMQAVREYIKKQGKA